MINEVAFLKQDQVDIVLDKVSVADYFAFAALLAIKDSDGPNMLVDWKYGRQDVKDASKLGSVDLIPNASNFKDNLRAKGFDNDEIVALASVQTFGVVQDPKKVDASKFPKLDNYAYKQVLLRPTQVKELDSIAIDSELHEVVKKFAEDQKAYHKSFESAFLKLIYLGQEEDNLTDIGHLLEDYPYKHFIPSHL